MLVNEISALKYQYITRDKKPDPTLMMETGKITNHVMQPFLLTFSSLHVRPLTSQFQSSERHHNDSFRNNLIWCEIEMDFVEFWIVNTIWAKMYEKEVET